MDDNELKELLLERLHIELQLFKDHMLQQDKEDIFLSYYKIGIYMNLYDIFDEHIDNLQVETVRKLLHLNFGILEFIYQEWLSREDYFMDELRAYACSELETISEIDSMISRKEERNGTEFNKAA